MIDQHARNYSRLGVRPGVSWKELRRAYKKLVNTWHPDRFQQDARQKKLAEEKTKEIIQSYTELAVYYKQFGVLPLPGQDEKSLPDADAGQTVPEKTADAETGPAEDSAPSPQPEPDAQPSGWRSRLMAAGAVIAATYLMLDIMPRQEMDVAYTSEQQNKMKPGMDNNMRVAPGHANEQQFAIGASLGDVYAIQGVPTRTENNVWHYGKSKVFFQNGKVTRWDENLDNPLKVRLMEEINNSTPRFFSRGSTKEEVLAVQGGPDRDAGNVWEYGMSQVYFEKDRVSGWHQGPLSPLRVRK